MKHSVALTLVLVAAFVMAQLVGLAIVHNYVDPVASAESGETQFRELPAVGGVALERPDVEESVSWAYILGAILVGTILLLILIKYAQVWIWKAWFFLAILVALYIAFAAFVNPIAAAVGAAIFAGLKFLSPTRIAVVVVQNFSELFIYGGLAAIFVPIFDVLSMVILLVLISAYDMYAVWKSKHMVKMAKFQTNSGVFAGLAIPYGLTQPKSASAAKKGTLQTAFLGGGDIAIPLLFTGTVLKVFGLVPALIVVPFTTIALFLLLYFAEQDKFYPAMPFLTAGCFVGFAVSWLVFLV